MNNPVNANPVNFHDVSPRALSIARMIDRLEAGTYHIELVRPPSKTERWQVTVRQSVTLRTMNLENRRDDIQDQNQD